MRVNPSCRRLLNESRREPDRGIQHRRDCSAQYSTDLLDRREATPGQDTGLGLHGVAAPGRGCWTANGRRLTGGSWSRSCSTTPIIDLDGVFLGTKHAILAMTSRGGGSIINVASV